MCSFKGRVFVVIFIFYLFIFCSSDLGDSVVKNLSANAGDMGSIPRSRGSPREEMATHSSILAWEIPWAEEPGGLQSMAWQRS